MSDICDDVFSLTPIINNEAVNRNEITSIASNSRGKIIAALLRNQLEKNLGLSGTGQEVSIMRSTLIRTGIWNEDNGIPKIILSPTQPHIANMMNEIEGFILSARRNGQLSFDVLYDTLTLPEYHIGLRRGLIPIFLAVVMHEYKQQILITDKHGPVQLSADALLQINANPASFTLSYIDWDPEKEDFIARLTTIFSEYVVEAEKGVNAYDFVVNAMKRWMMSLPKYSKESKLYPNGKKIEERYISMMRLLRQNGSGYELLFVKLPSAFGYEGHFSVSLADNVEAAKAAYDSIIERLKQSLSAKTKVMFLLPQNGATAGRMSLSSVIKD